jgi:hypothetical protein
MKNEKIMIGYIDTDPDTGEDYPYNPICETECEYMANWIVGTLSRDLGENADQPNRRIVIKKC